MSHDPRIEFASDLPYAHVLFVDIRHSIESHEILRVYLDWPKNLSLSGTFGHKINDLLRRTITIGTNLHT